MTYAEESKPQTSANDPIAELKARMDRLEKEDQELRQVISSQSLIGNATPGMVMGSV